MTKVKDWLEGIPSKNTRKSYRNGTRKFEEYYGKGIETLIGSEDAGKVVEKFFVWLKEKGYTQNSARNLVNPPIQFLKFFNTPVKYRKSLGMYKTVPTTRDHLLNAEEAREMYKVADLSEKVMVKTWLLGLRISDASRLEWKQFEVTNPSNEPIEIEVYTRKEDVVAHIFLDSEFQELLTKHIGNLDKNNIYLFQSEKGDRVSEKQLLRRLQSLQKRAHVKAKGRFGWHIGRKLFLRTCAELGVNQWNAKLMCGKAVSKDIMTYINGVSLKTDAKRVARVLRMEEIRTEGISTVEETAKIVTEVLSEMVKPIVGRVLLERSMSQNSEGTVGLLEKPDLSTKSPKEILELYLKLKREEDE
jgi:integrase